MLPALEDGTVFNTSLRVRLGGDNPRNLDSIPFFQPTPHKELTVPETVIKRDGSTVAFDRLKIEEAIGRALKEAGKEPSEAVRLTDEVLPKLEGGSYQVWEIQAAVENTLLEEDPELARTYISYRVDRDVKRARLKNSVDKLIEADPTVVNENANKDSRSFTTIRDLMAGSVARPLGLSMLPPRVADAHTRGLLHWHDLDYSPFTPFTNCCLPDFKELFKGYKMGNAEIEPPKGIGTAVAQLTQIILNIASSQYGGISVNRADELLAPYAELTFKKQLTFFKESDFISPKQAKQLAEKATKKLVFDALQELEYSLNASQASTGQTPFITVNFGLGTGKWEREIQYAILKVRRDGVGPNKKTSIFPKLVYTLKDGVNLKEGDPNYDVKQAALDCAIHRIYPDVLNYDKLVEFTGGFKAPMGCRSLLPTYINPETGEEEVEGRMNLGVVTLNLPRVALDSGTIDDFWKLLDARLEVVKEALDYRMARTFEAEPDGAPILYRQGAFGKRLGPDDEVKQLFDRGRSTLSLGYIGVFEAVAKYYGGFWEVNPEAVEFSRSIVRHLWKKANEWTTPTSPKYSVYATPSESLTNRFCSIDRELFGEVKDITDKGYYTNSFHYDVRKTPTPFEKIDFESAYLPFTPGGQICYVEAPVNNNIEALEALWDYAYTKVAYFGVNTPIDHCSLCQFTGDFAATDDGYQCPKCGNTDPETFTVTKRLCGYLGSLETRPPVEGRKKEIQARRKHY